MLPKLIPRQIFSGIKERLCPVFFLCINFLDEFGELDRVGTPIISGTLPSLARRICFLPASTSSAQTPKWLGTQALYLSTPRLVARLIHKVPGSACRWTGGGILAFAERILPQRGRCLRPQPIWPLAEFLFDRV